MNNLIRVNMKHTIFGLPIQNSEEARTLLIPGSIAHRQDLVDEALDIMKMFLSEENKTDMQYQKYETKGMI
jgi:hypothetical protein